MYLTKKDFGVVEKEKLIFLNKDVYKNICSIEKTLTITFIYLEIMFVRLTFFLFKSDPEK